MGEIIGLIADSVVAITAATALFLAWRQIHISRELAALQAYENYHLTCLAYPQFSGGDVDFQSLPIEELRSYELFVLYTLMMDERIFALFPKDPAWIFSIKDDIRMHRNFLRSPQFATHLIGQGWHIRPIIDEVLSEVEDPPTSVKMKRKAKPRTERTPRERMRTHKTVV